MHKTTDEGWDQETSNSDANYIVLQAQNDRCGLGPMESSNSGANHAVLNAQKAGKVWHP